MLKQLITLTAFFLALVGPSLASIAKNSNQRSIVFNDDLITKNPSTGKSYIVLKPTRNNFQVRQLKPEEIPERKPGLKFFPCESMPIAISGELISFTFNGCEYSELPGDDNCDIHIYLNETFSYELIFKAGVTSDNNSYVMEGMYYGCNEWICLPVITAFNQQSLGTLVAGEVYSVTDTGIFLDDGITFTEDTTFSSYGMLGFYDGYITDEFVDDENVTNNEKDIGTMIYEDWQSSEICINFSLIFGPPRVTPTTSPSPTTTQSNSERQLSN